MNQEEYAAYLKTDRWGEVRDRALAYAEHRCQICNGNEKLQVHHRTYERVGHERPADLTVLCETCHATFHDRLRGRRVALSATRQLEEYEAPRSDNYLCVDCGSGPWYRKQGQLMTCQDCEPEYRKRRSNAARARVGLPPWE